MSSSPLRLKRPPPERSAPIRNPFAGSSPRTAPDPEPSSNGSRRGPLECGVQTAYAVIDEYMRRGYEAARDNQQQQNGGDYMNYDRSNYGNPYSNPYSSPFNAWGPASPII